MNHSPDPVREASRDAWTALWHSRVLHACTTDADGNYEGVVRAFWQERFASLADGDVVVDIGTGNGAIALMAARHGLERGIRLEIHGVDRADIDPRQLPAWQGLPVDVVRFHPNTDCTRLPLAESSVALLCAQYAFEYMDVEAMTAEILRVLVPGGCAALVMHASDSVISDTLQYQLRAYEQLLREGGVFELSAAATDGDALKMEAVRREVRALIALGTELPQADVLRQGLACVRDALREPDPGRACAILDGGLAALQAQRHRLFDLQAAIRSPDALRAIAQGFDSCGCSAELAPLDEADGQRLGWTLRVVAHA